MSKINRRKLVEELGALSNRLEQIEYHSDGIEVEAAGRELTNASYYTETLNWHEERFNNLEGWRQQQIRQSIVKGGVYTCRYDKNSVGSEMRDVHHVVVLNGPAYRRSNTVIVSPLTYAGSIREHLAQEQLAYRQGGPATELAVGYVPCEIYPQHKTPWEGTLYVHLRQTCVVSIARLAGGLKAADGPRRIAQVKPDCLAQIEERLEKYLGFQYSARLEERYLERCQAKDLADEKIRQMRICIEAAKGPLEQLKQRPELANSANLGSILRELEAALNL